MEDGGYKIPQENGVLKKKSKKKNGGWNKK